MAVEQRRNTLLPQSNEPVQATRADTINLFLSSLPIQSSILTSHPCQILPSSEYMRSLTILMRPKLSTCEEGFARCWQAKVRLEAQSLCPVPNLKARRRVQLELSIFDLEHLSLIFSVFVERYLYCLSIQRIACH